jgi:hypothetical protein
VGASGLAARPGRPACTSLLALEGIPASPEGAHRVLPPGSGGGTRARHVPREGGRPRDRLCRLPGVRFQTSWVDAAGEGDDVGRRPLQARHPTCPGEHEVPGHAPGIQLRLGTRSRHAHARAVVPISRLFFPGS